MTPVLLNSTIRTRAALAWTKKKRSLRNGKLKVNRAAMAEASENKNNKKQRLAILKRLKRGDENKLERSLTLEKVVASKQVGHETEEERRARLENHAAPKWLRLAMEMDEERNARLER